MKNLKSKIWTFSNANILVNHKGKIWQIFNSVYYVSRRSADKFDTIVSKMNNTLCEKVYEKFKK
jgi:hypothetical protein